MRLTLEQILADKQNFVYGRSAFEAFRQDSAGAQILSSASEKEVWNLYQTFRKMALAERKMDSSLTDFASDTEIKKEWSRQAKMDAEGLYIARDLEDHDQRRFQILREDVSLWSQYFPVVTQGSPGQTTYRYDMYDGTGVPEVLSDGAADFPMVSANRKSYTRDVKHKGLGYDYTVDELRAAMTGQQPLDMMKIMRVARGYDQMHYNQLWDGDTDLSMPGAIDFSGVPNAQAADGDPGAGTAITWADKVTGGFIQSVIDDIGDLVSTINVNTQNVYANESKPVNIGIPLAQYNLINRTARSTTSDTTILAYALQNIRGLGAIIPIINLAGKGTGSSDLMIGWINDPEVVEYRITMPVTWQPMERRGMRYIFQSDTKFVGFVLRYTATMAQIYGI